MLRGFLFGCVVRVVAWGFVLWLGRSGVDRVMGGWVCWVVTSRCLAFFGGLCVGAKGEGWQWSWVWVRVCGLLRVIVVGEGEAYFGLVLEVGCVCLLRRVR